MMKEIRKVTFKHQQWYFKTKNIFDHSVEYDSHAWEHGKIRIKTYDALTIGIMDDYRTQEK